MALTFKSKLEAWCWKLLNKYKPKTTTLAYETERLPFTLTRYYVPDFIVTLKSGTKRYIEAKGYFRSDDRTKLLAVQRGHPGIDLRLVFSQDNRLRKGSKSKYSDWARKNGFPYSIGSIPREWLK